ncbi:hypothetical protein ACIQCR_24625 [Streptomyces sp. NPDC093249]|uniref:hypothetical protein n=1 Tax=unclassified Streptomyces TaxID=2593676 RepID=UPI003811EEC7
MQRSPLPRHARAHTPGWTHPYETGLLSPLLYADGGAGDDDENDGQGEEDPSEDPAEENDGQEQPDEGDPAGADQLGDAGKKALDSMKTRWKDERTKRRQLEQQLTAQSGGEADQARQQAEADALAKANSRILKAEIRAAAKGRLTDPKDALTFLDLGAFEVGEDGEIDPEEIEEAITDLLKTKPYLAAATAKRFQGTGDGGAARKAPRPKQLTRQDLKTMTPQQIVKAKAEGRLDDVLGAAD